VKSVKIKSTSTPSEESKSMVDPRPTRAPPAIPKLEGQFLQDCMRAVHGSPFDDNIKQGWIANLNAADSLTHAPLLYLLLSMVSNVDELYLGACKLYDVPFLFGMLNIFVDDVIIQKQLSSMSCIVSTLGSKLRILELPNDGWLTATGYLHRATMGPFATLFPCHETLIISKLRLDYPLMDEDNGFCRYSPASLERLIVVDSNHSAIGPKLRPLILNKKSRIPRLREINVTCTDTCVGPTYSWQNLRALTTSFMNFRYTSCTFLVQHLLTRTYVPLMYTLRTLHVHLMYIESIDDPYGRHGFLTPSIDLLLCFTGSPAS
jgi:hypothetical protein